MKPILLILSAIIGLTYGEAPYAPSSWKPTGALLVLPVRQQQPVYQPSIYGPPEQKNDTEQSTQDESKNNETGIVTLDKLKEQDKSQSGTYYVLLPDGRLQKVEYATAPLKEISVDERSKQDENNQNKYKKEQEQLNLQQNYNNQLLGFNKYQESTYQRINSKQPKGFGNQAANENYNQFSNAASNSQQQFAAYNQQQDYNQQTNAYWLNNNNYQNNNAGQSNDDQTRYAQQNNENRNQFSYNKKQFENEKPEFNNKNIGQFDKQNNFNRVDAEQTPHPAVAAFSEAQYKIAADAEKLSMTPIIATVQYTNVKPISAPVYAYNPAPLVRIIRRV